MTSERWLRIKKLFDLAFGSSAPPKKPSDPARSDDTTPVSRSANQPLKNTLNIVDFSLVPGEVVSGRYRIERPIGRGGMGEVYEARDQLLNEAIALKTLRAELARREEIVKRFHKEIQLARKVTHPNVCRVFETGLHQPLGSIGPALPYFTMELLEGETLSQRIRRVHRLSREDAFPLAVQMAEGLHAAHEAGIVHADFKSGNVILVAGSHGERAVITDFGLARIDPATTAPDETHSMNEYSPIAGTVAYMSPEQMAGGTVSASSDIYSYGIVLFEMATGKLPFDERHVIQSAMQRGSDESVKPRALVPDLDSRWDLAIGRCLQKKPQRRFSSALAIADLLRENKWRMPGRYWTRREWIPALTGAGVVTAAFGGYVIWSRRPYLPDPAALDWYQKGVTALHSMTYETARRALTQAISIDPRFALAHACLARAYDELDYTDLAKDSILRAVLLAEETRLTKPDSTRLQALRFMVSREYDRAAPLFRQLEESATVAEKPAAALESGWLAQQRGDTTNATAEYERAAKLNPGYATAHLRLGYILGRRGRDDAAIQEFSEAERLYNAASNFEGVTETLIQRASLLIRRSRAAEALPVIDRALAVSRTVHNRYQEIELINWQGVAARIQGDNNRSVQLVQQAINAAIAEKMDNLATALLVDLGNSYLIRGDNASAEARFRQALDQSKRGKVRRLEYRALTSLGSLCEQEHRPEEAKQFILTVLPFYRQSGYRRELIQAAGILGGALNDLAEYEEGIRVLRDTMPNAVELKDSQLEARLRERLGDNLRGKGDWPASLAEYEKARSLTSGVTGRFARVYCAQMYWRLGRRADAEQSLSELQRLLKNGPGQMLLCELKTEMAYAAGHMDEAGAGVRQGKAVAAAGDELDPDLSLLEALVQIRTGKGGDGLAAATTLATKFEQSRLTGAAASVRLATAEALLLSGRNDSALQWARAALEFFEPRHIWESILRGHLIAARAAHGSIDENTHLASAHAALDQLRSAWSAPVVDAYWRRPDIQRLLQGIRF